ncbi:M14 family metallopeptidase [Maribellus maritimus]|uniref:M14 family metallopeptidase n=1 Tax=Maribellus maritimus TaxID=2870838 RepID=UPI001EEAE115|nr:M14 metallopeptidase family protein [Maribellus maritimus]MCG6187553.1 hypothetical protein [Maribellus maritimus]
MKNHLKTPVFLFLIFVFVLNTFSAIAQNKITSPEEFFGFQMGADYKLARWDKIVNYFYELEKQSDKIKVTNLGPSSEGHPFLLLLISSSKNMTNLDRLQTINKKISDPRGVSEDSLKTYIKEGKAVIFESMSLHASEVGGTQMSPELAYDLLTKDDEETQRILDNVLFFMVPCFNPDGQVMITDWYNETVGTEYEGLSMPYLYHKYCGHDNNRDGDYLNLQESRYMAKAMYVDWQPQAYVDHHHMGSYGARFYVPPYCDPIRPYADPLVWRELSWYGAHIAYKLEEDGFQGVLNAAQYAGWGHFGWHWITPFHNIAGMLTESATANYATPVYVHPEQLRANTRGFPEYEAQSTFPNPWPGGWWHLRNIVAQQKSSAWSILDLAARNKETVLKTAVIKAQNQTKRGAEDNVKTLVIPAEQHDYLTATKMINKLLQSGLEIKKANKQFVAENRVFGAGSYVISLAQPKMGLIKNLLTETHYADNSWTRSENGVPYRPYDLATHTMYEFMGVNVEGLHSDLISDFPILQELENVPGTVEKGNSGYWIDGKQNAAFLVVNLLQNEKIQIKRVDKAFEGLHPGDFIIEKAPAEKLNEIAEKAGLSFLPLNKIEQEKIHTVKRGRTGLFQRYYGGNMDEGWTRLCFENFGFDYTTLMSEEIKEGSLNKKYDVIVLPNDRAEAITGDLKGQNKQEAEEYPEKYRSGIDKEGTEALKEYVKNGGTLVAFGNSFEFAADAFNLKVTDVTNGLKSIEWFCPGSTLKVDFDNTQPLAYGMPDEGVVLNFSSPAFEVVPGRHNDDYTTIVRYKDKSLLKSGWLIGEKTVAKKQAMLSVKYGEGEVVLIGFRTQHRNQTDATFKLLFNTIIR